MKKRVALLAVLLLLFTVCPVWGEEELLSDLDFTEVEELLDETQLEEISFSEMVSGMMRGEIPLEPDMIIDLIKTAFLGEIQENGTSMAYLLLLAVLSAALTNFTKVFERNKTADISFFVVYLLLLAVLLQSYRSVQSVAESVLLQMTEFMKLLIPTYMLTIAAAKGATTATVFYEFLIGLIYVVNLVLFRVLLPLSNVYVVLGLVNYMSKEDMLSRMAELIKMLVGWGLKTMLAVVIGLNIVQGLITPAVDTFKTTAIHRAVSAVPGIGNAMNAVTETVIGSGMLIKNSVGVGILIILVLISLVPVLKMAVLLLMYKVAGALIQPVSDKRMCDCINVVSEGVRLLLRCLTTSFVLFFITIAILAVSTSIGV